MSFGAPLSPSERLSNTPDPPRLICWASVAPMVKSPSPGWAVMAIIFPGVWDEDSPNPEELTKADSATAPPNDCAKERRFIASPSEFESSSYQIWVNFLSPPRSPTRVLLVPTPSVHNREGSRYLRACLPLSSLGRRRAVVRARTSPSARRQGTGRRRWTYLHPGQ